MASCPNCQVKIPSSRSLTSWDGIRCRCGVRLVPRRQDLYLWGILTGIAAWVTSTFAVSAFEVEGKSAKFGLFMVSYVVFFMTVAWRVMKLERRDQP